MKNNKNYQQFEKLTGLTDTRVTRKIGGEEIEHINYDGIETQLEERYPEYPTYDGSQQEFIREKFGIEASKIYGRL